MARSKSVVAVVAVAALVAGCASDTLRSERGGAVAAAGSVAAARARTFVAQVASAREEANIALVASDASCAWGASLILRGSGRAAPKLPKQPPLCLPRGRAADPALGDLTVSLRPVSDTALRPTIAAIDALATYLDAVNTVVATKAPDVAGQLADAYGKAVAAQGAIAAVTGDDRAALPALDDDQQAAIGGLVRLIADLAAGQRKADRLGALARAQNPAVLATIARLRALVVRWSASSLAGDLQMTDATFASLGRQLAADPPYFAGFEARRALLRQIVTAKRNTQAVPALTAVLTTALDEMAAAQTALIAAYTANPGWTAGERATAARLNRERLLGALSAVGAVVAAFAV